MKETINNNRPQFGDKRSGTTSTITPLWDWLRKKKKNEGVADKLPVVVTFILTDFVCQQFPDSAAESGNINNTGVSVATTIIYIRSINLHEISREFFSILDEYGEIPAIALEDFVKLSVEAIVKRIEDVLSFIIKRDNILRYTVTPCPTKKDVETCPQTPKILEEPKDAEYDACEHEACCSTEYPFRKKEDLDSHYLYVLADVTDGGELTYQWYVNTVDSNVGGKLIPGATEPRYLPPTFPAGVYYYYCIITNNTGGAFSASAVTRPAKITVNPVYAAEPVITAHPASSHYHEATGSIPLFITSYIIDGGVATYQWFENNTPSNTGGTKINGATGSAYTANVNSVGTKYYYCEVTNTPTDPCISGTSTVASNAAEIIVMPLYNAEQPSLKQLKSVEYGLCTDAEPLTVDAKISDMGELSYQWYKSPIDSNMAGQPITGATSPTYTPPKYTTVSDIAKGKIQYTDFYYCIVTNNNPSVSGAKSTKVVSQPARVDYVLVSPEEPVLTEQPVGAAYKIGETAVALRVTATITDGGTLSYQWFKQGSSTVLSTAATYTPPTTASDIYFYYCVITNSPNNNCRTGKTAVTSDVVRVKVIQKPVINNPDSSDSFSETKVFKTCENEFTRDVEKIRLNALQTIGNVTDDGTLTYQWYKSDTATGEGIPVIGATDSTYLTPTLPAGVFYYYCIVTSTNEGKKDSAKSPVYTVNVEQLTPQEPIITAHPASSVHNEGTGSIPLFVDAYSPDGGTIYYQWYETNSPSNNSTGTILPNATGSAYTPYVNATGEKYYYARVINRGNAPCVVGENAVNSNVAAITIKTVINAEQPNICHPISQKYGVCTAPKELFVNAKVSDDGKLSYQWYTNTNSNNKTGQPIAGATNPTYTPSTKVSPDITYYYVIVTNVNESVTGAKKTKIVSQTAKIEYVPSKPSVPVIITQPADGVYAVNETFTPLFVEVETAGDGNLTYQWYKNLSDNNIGGVMIPGATSASYPPPATPSPTELAGTWFYYVVITNSANAGQPCITGSSEIVSETARIKVIETPAIIEEPQARFFYACENENCCDIDLMRSNALSATGLVTDGGVLTYQWYKNTAVTGEGTLILGATDRIYVPPTLPPGVMYYRCVITSTNEGKQSSVATNWASVEILEVFAKKPVITGQPGSSTYLEGTGIIPLFVEATSPEDIGLTYQWYSNTSRSTLGGTAIPGALGSVYSPVITEPGTYYYYCIVTNVSNTPCITGSDAAASEIAVITITTLLNAEQPSIFQLVSAEYALCESSDVEALVVNGKVTDGGIITYQWYSNNIDDTASGVEIPGAILSSYTPPTQSTVTTTYYYCVVTNTNENATGQKVAKIVSQPAKISFTDAVSSVMEPIITRQPQSAVYSKVADIVPVEVMASSVDGGTLTYQWYENDSDSTLGGLPIDGETNSSYMPVLGSESIVKYFYAEVTNSHNSQCKAGDATITSEVAVIEFIVVEEPTLDMGNLPNLTIDLCGTNDCCSVPYKYTLNATASASQGDVTYQWYYNNQDDPYGSRMHGETNPILIPSSSEVGTSYYYCEITVTYRDVVKTVRTNRAKVEVKAVNAQPPVINVQPESSSYIQPDVPIPLFVMAESPDGGKLSYQWAKKASGDSSFINIPGAVNSTYFPQGTLDTIDYQVTVTNTGNGKCVLGNSSVISNPATVVVKVLNDAEQPNINQPRSTKYRLCANATVAALTVDARVSDGGTLSYQWFKQGSSTVLSTAATYTPTKYTVANTSYYYVIVTNTNNNPSITGDTIAQIISQPAKIEFSSELAATPVITTQPAPSTIYELNNPNIPLEVEAYAPDGGTLTYQWQERTATSEADCANCGGTFTNVASGGTSSMYIPSTNTEYAKCFRVIITNTVDGTAACASTATSTCSYVKVKRSPAIPSVAGLVPSVTDWCASTPSITVAAMVHYGTLSYQWYANTTPTVTITPSTLTLGTSATQQLPAVSSSNKCSAYNYYYFVVVTSTYDGQSVQVPTAPVQAFRSVVNAAPITGLTINTYTNYSITYNKGATAAPMTVSASGGVGSLTVKWESNTTSCTYTGTWTNVSSAATFTPSTATVGTTYYRATLTRTASSCQCNNAVATICGQVTVVTPPAQQPTITTNPLNKNQCYGVQYCLTVDASVTDGGTLSYQWYRTAGSNVNPVGTNSAEYCYTPVAGDVGYYEHYVTVTNTNAEGMTASANSGVAAITITNRTSVTPTVSLTSNKTTAVTGEEITLTASASGTGLGNYTYNFRQKPANNSVQNTTSNTYKFTPSSAGTYQYDVQATSGLIPNNCTDVNVGTSSTREITVTSACCSLVLSYQGTANSDGDQPPASIEIFGTSLNSGGSSQTICLSNAQMQAMTIKNGSPGDALPTMDWIVNFLSSSGQQAVPTADVAKFETPGWNFLNFIGGTCNSGAQYRFEATMPPRACTPPTITSQPGGAVNFCVAYASAQTMTATASNWTSMTVFNGSTATSVTANYSGSSSVTSNVGTLVGAGATTLKMRFYNGNSACYTDTNTKTYTGYTLPTVTVTVSGANTAYTGDTVALSYSTSAVNGTVIGQSWEKYSGGSWTSVSTSTTYTVSSTETAAPVILRYRVKLSMTNGQCTGDVTSPEKEVTVEEAPSTCTPPPPVITSQPAVINACARVAEVSTLNDLNLTWTGNIGAYCVYDPDDLTAVLCYTDDGSNPDSFIKGIKDYVNGNPPRAKMVIRFFPQQFDWPNGKCYTDIAIPLNRVYPVSPSDITVITSGDQTIGVGETFNSIIGGATSTVGTFDMGYWVQRIGSSWSHVTDSTMVDTTSLDTSVPTSYRFQYRVKYKIGNCTMSNYASSDVYLTVIASCNCSLETNIISGKTQYYYGCDTNSFEALTVSATPPEVDCSITGYQWYNSLDLGATYTAIPGATSASCTPTSAIVYSAETPYRVDVTLHNSTFGCDKTVSRFTSVKICQYIEITRATLRIFGTWIGTNRDNQFILNSASLICSSDISTGTGGTPLNITSAGYTITGGVELNSKQLNSMTLQFTITNSSNSYGFVRVYSTLNCSSTNEIFTMMRVTIGENSSLTFTNANFVTGFCPAKIGPPPSGAQDAAYITIEVSDQPF
jgi:hypothetical protein